MGNKTSLGRKFFVFCNTLFLLLLVLTMIIPFWRTLVISLSSNLASMHPGIHLWPSHFSIQGYITAWNRVQLWLPFTNSVVVTIVGTAFHVFFSAMAGFVLAQKDLPGRRWLTIAVMITMMVPWEAIMIPVYVVNQQLGLLNTLASLIISGLVSGFSILLMRNFFMAVPYDLLESARMDGAGYFRVFFQIFLPLSKPGLATITLFNFVAKWNDFTSPLLFINDPKKYTLQIALNAIINQKDSISSSIMLTNNVKMAGIMMGIIPLIIIYPFAQKYFIKGIMLGSTKE